MHREKEHTMPVIALKPNNGLSSSSEDWGDLAGLPRHVLVPAHANKTLSLSIREGHDGILIHCFSGCDPDDVLRRILRWRLG
jgi:hypothetical protein